jgi:hypothetical protein
MEHLVVDFKHDIEDIIPFSEFVKNIKLVLAQAKVGEYLNDDMAIDGGDAEAFFSCPDARILFKFLEPHLRRLSFMHQAKVTLVFGPLDSGSETIQIVLD